MGWSYWFAWVVTGIADLVAITGYARFWWPGLPIWVPALVTVALILAVNLFSVRHFGELEFWFALIKVAAIVCLIAVGAILVATNFVSPHGVHATIENLWNDNGFFPTGFLGVVSGFQIAFFAYIGVELVGTAAAETADPRRTLPRAINAVPLRVAVFYIGALLAILAVVPWRQFASGESPFVTMFSLAGLAAAASVVNFVVVTAAASSANSGFFSTGRMLFGLADEGHAPAAFHQLNRGGVPAPALLLTAPLLLTSIPLLYAGRSVIGAFTLVTTVSSLLFMFVWAMIIISYLVYRRRHPQRHTDSVYKMPGGVVMCWAVLVFFRVRDLDTYHRNRNRNRVGVVPAMVRAARRGLARHPAPAEPPQLWFSLPGRRGSSAARPRYGQACNENPRAAQTPKCGRRRASVSR